MDIPGAYPATPAAVGGETQQHKQLSASHDPQGRSNLHEEVPRRQEHRGHSHTDSGVVLTGADPNPHSRDNRDHQSPLAKLGNLAHHGSTNQHPPKSTSQDIGSTEAPPYWGDLPRATGGGIYNTVTGHGSPTDDHDQHHHLPPQTRAVNEPAADSNIDRAATDIPTGGVYNTITGHGSREDGQYRQQDVTGDVPQQDSSMRGVLIAGAAGAAAGNARPSGGHTAPVTSHVDPRRELASNPAPAAKYDAARGVEHQSQSGHTPAAGAFAVPGGRHEQHLTNPHATNAHVATDSAVASKSLAPAPVADRSNNQRTNAGLAAGAGVAGGVTASELAHRHSKEQQPAVPPVDERRHGEHYTREQPAAGVVFHRYKEEGHSAEKHRHEEPTKRHSSDKHEHEDDKSHRKSGVFGIFHRHKDEKDSSSSERAKLTKEPPSPRVGDTARDTAHHEKEKLRADSPPKVKESGGLGLFHHQEDKTVDNQHSHRTPVTAEKSVQPAAVSSRTHGYSDPREAEHSRAAPVPMAAASSRTHGYEEPRESERSRAGPALAAAGAGAGAGLAASSISRRHEESQRSNEAAASAQPPSPRQFDLLPSHQKTSGQGTGTHSAAGASNDRVQYNVLSSGTPSGVKVQPRDSARSHHEPTNTTAAIPTLAPHDYHGSANTTTCAVTADVDDGQYKELPSGTASIMKAGHHDSVREGSERISSRRTDAVAAGAVGTAVAAAAAATPLSKSTGATDRSTDSRTASGQYNVLASGTPSGVKLGHDGSSHSRDETLRQDETRDVSSTSHHNQPRDAALAASTSAWASSTPATTSKVVHQCENCGKDNDISQYFTKDSLSKLVGN